jgi:hypothetical protein
LLKSEVESLKAAFEENCICKKCKGPVEAEVTTLCLATSFVISCKDENYGHVYYSNPPAESHIRITHRTVQNHERMANYAVNVLYVLGFLSSGDGGREAACILGLLGLPNDTTMESRSFCIIEETISPAIQRLSGAILLETLQEEVHLTMEASTSHDASNFNIWEQARQGKIEVTPAKYATVSVSFKERKTMTRMDSTRIGKNFGYIIRSLSRMPGDQYCRAGSAVLQHNFDMHDNCGLWCPRKRQTVEQCAASGRYYRDMNKKMEKELYAVLEEKVAQFISFKRLKEVAHGMDTQVNESFNNTVSWFAPKNKVYFGTQSLTNRIGLALGVNTLGLLVYFKRLFAALHINMTDNVLHFLEVKSNKRVKRLAKLKTKEENRERSKHKFDQLKEDTLIAIKERSKRDGTYKKGMNMAEGNIDGYTEEDLNNNRRKPKSKTAVDRSGIECKHCHLFGHRTIRSKHCLLYVPPTRRNQVRPPGAPTAEDLRASADIDAFDSVPLKDDPSDVDDMGLAGFFDDLDLDEDAWSDNERVIDRRI